MADHKLTLQQRLDRASHIKDMLESDIFVAMVTGMEAAYVKRWLETEPDQIDERETAWAHVKVLQEIVSNMRQMVSDGIFAVHAISEEEKRRMS